MVSKKTEMLLSVRNSSHTILTIAYSSQDTAFGICQPLFSELVLVVLDTSLAASAISGSKFVASERH